MSNQEAAVEIVKIICATAIFIFIIVLFIGLMFGGRK
jgi:hypothetical protein